MAETLIVGGGLCGSLLAIYLARKGHAVRVFERLPDDRGPSATTRPALNITLCERGLAALEGVGLSETALALAVPARGRQIHGVDGARTFQPYGNKGEAIYSISRGDLNRALVERASKEPGVSFHFGQKCTHMDLASGALQFLDAATGETRATTAEVVFGADGAYSTVRGHFQRIEYFSHSLQYWGRGAYKSLWVPPPAHGGPALEGEALHVWPRGSKMLMGFPNRDGSAMLSLLLPRTGENSFERLADAASLSNFFQAFFPDVAQLIPSLAQQFFAKPANSLVTVRCDPWSHQGKALLLGDAAHALLPSYGQGANAAFEDCAVLSQCLLGRDRWPEIFAEFERIRRPSLDVMATLCVEHFDELTDLIADPAFLRQREIERRLAELYPDSYQTLYSMVSFGTSSYADAHEIDQRQRRAVELIMKLDHAEERLDSAEVRGLLERAAQGGLERPSEVASGVQVDATAEESPFTMGMRFWDAKVILSAVELGVFQAIASGARSVDDLCTACGIHPRGARDFLDSLVAQGLLTRSLRGYANSARAEQFLVPTSASYVGGALELANARLYPVWGKLSEALRSGLPQNEAQQEEDYYGSLASNAERLRTFLQAMTGLSVVAAKRIAEKFDFSRHRTFADVGGAQGVLAVELARTHPHLTGTNFDLAPVGPIFASFVEQSGFSERLRFQAGDFFVDPLPKADVIVMGHVLHNWGLEQKRLLVRKAFDALPVGGALIVYEALLDDERRGNLFGLLMSLNMLLVTSAGFVFSGSECAAWMNEAGFSRTLVEHLDGPDSMVIGFK